MTSAHSNWSASGFEAVMLCPGKKVLEAGLPDRTSEYAAEGTAAHQVLTWALQDGNDAVAYLGRVIRADGYTFTCDDDMAGYVQVCVDYVRDVAGAHGVILVDRKVNYSRYLGVDASEAWGTLDVTILLPDEIVVIDFKYGRGVEVGAGEDGPERDESIDLGGQTVDVINVTTKKPNPQLALYGLGALDEFGDLGDFHRVRLVISQPRIVTAPSEYDLSVDELEQWGNTTARSAVASCVNAQRMATDDLEKTGPQWQETFLRPAEKACKFCRAKATCPALRDDALHTLAGTDLVHAATPDEFEAVLDQHCSEKPGAADDQDWIEMLVDKADLIEGLLSAARAELERRLLAGEPSKRFKLVEGKQGNRAWSNKTEVEAQLKSMRLKVEEMYDLSLISPTTAEKLSKAKTIGPRQWTKLQTLITRAPAKKHVAPLSDPRPALVVTPVVEDFDVVTTEPATDLA